LKLTTSELVYINEAAKALKQKDFILIGNAMIGLDNIQNIVTYLLLDNNFFINHIDGIIINQRALSAFIKSLSIESEFEINFIDGIATIHTLGEGLLEIKLNNYLAEMACNKFRYVISLEGSIPTVLEEIEVPDITSRIQSMSKSDGGIGINYNGYYMTLFSTILPITKSDKIYLKILQPPIQHTFISKFHIKKKKFDIITYINYLKV
jgi:hypothetical protein